MKTFSQLTESLDDHLVESKSDLSATFDEMIFKKFVELAKADGLNMSESEVRKMLTTSPNLKKQFGALRTSALKALSAKKAELEKGK